MNDVDIKNFTDETGLNGVYAVFRYFYSFINSYSNPVTHPSTVMFWVLGEVFSNIVLGL